MKAWFRSSCRQTVRKSLLQLAALLAPVAACWSTAAAQSCDIMVTTLADSGEGSLRTAISTASNDPYGPLQICFDASLQGTITLTSGTLAITGPLSIQGTGVTVSGSDQFGVFTVDLPSADSTVNISNLTISHGLSTLGGGIHVLGGNVTLNNILVENNSADAGGGVYNQGTLTMIGGQVSSNSATNGLGGGIVNLTGGTMTVEGTLIQSNTSSISSGGGIANGGGLQLQGSFAINSNDAASSGGGIFNQPRGLLNIVDGNFQSNSAEGQGGAIFNQGSVTIGRTSFVQNQAQGSSGASGGALENASTAQVTESTFAQNVALGTGGAIDNAGTLTLMNDTLAGNNSGIQGGGLNTSSTTPPTIENTIISGNTAPESPDCYGCSAGNEPATLIGGTVSLGSLALNGGPSYTMIPLPGSAAIGTGNASLTADATDQRGLSRLTAGALDIGAVQTHYSSVEIVQQPSGAAVGATIAPPVQVRVVETDGEVTNYPSGVPVTMRLLASDGTATTATLSGTLQQSPTATGSATSYQVSPISFSDLSVNAAGSYELLASIDGSTTAPNANPTFNGVSQVFAITPPPAKQAQISLAGSAPVYGAPFQIICTVTDTNGQPFTGGNCTLTADGTTQLGSTPVNGGTGTITVSNLSAGTHSITGTFSDSATEQSFPLTLSVTIAQATPVLTWPTPAPIVSGTALSATQLNASAAGVSGASLAGNYEYNPPAGTTLTAGSQTLSVTFTPGDTVNYSTATATVSIQVNAATLTSLTIASGGSSAYVGVPDTVTVTALDQSGNPLTAFTGPLSLTSSDTAASFSPAVFSDGIATATVTFSAAGQQTVTAASGAISATSGTITVAASAPAFVVTTATDDAEENSANCTPQTGSSTSDANCSLRDALAAAASAGAGNITFLPSLFGSTQQKIQLTDALSVPSNTTIVGPRPSGSAVNLVTLDGGGTVPVFAVGEGVTSATIEYLNIQNGTLPADTTTTAARLASGQGGLHPQPKFRAGLSSMAALAATLNAGGITNDGALSVLGCVISGNQGYANYYVQNAGGIYNNGTMTLTESTVSGNASTQNGFVPDGYGTGATGGGIINYGTMTVTRSLISANQAPGGVGGGIMNGQTMTLTESTVSGNTGGVGAGVYTRGTMVVTNSTITGNTFVSATGSEYKPNSGGGLYNLGTVTLANSIVAGNALTGDTGTYADVQDDSDGGGVVDRGGNVDTTDSASPSTLAPQLSSLGNYGGPTQTAIPLPGSPAICAGTQANLAGATTDQRGYPATNGNYAETPCVDAGAVQTNYSLAFSTEPQPIPPAAEILPGAAFTAAVTLTESGQPFTAAAVTIPLSLNGSGTLANSTAVTGTGGIATYPALQVSAPGTGDTLTAALPLNTAASTAPAASAKSSAFTVGILAAQAQLSLGTPTPVFGAPFQIVCTVTDSTGLPFSGGECSLTADGNNPLGSATVTSGSGSLTVATLPAGAHAITGTYTNSLTGQNLPLRLSFTIAQAVPVLTWAQPAAIFTSTPLSGTQLDASAAGVNGASLPGSFAYDPTAGATLAAGPHVLSVSFRPQDSVDYSTATAQVTITVNAPTAQSVSVSESANPITFGQSVTLTATVPGTDGKPLSGGTAAFTSDGAPVGSAAVQNGTATVTASSLAAGTHQIGVTYTNTATHQTLTGNSSLTVNKAAPVLAWAPPAPIFTSTPLSGTQLNATATGVTGAALPGAFVYTPAAGTLLTAGTHTLSVTFTPTDAVDYTTATAQAAITVNAPTAQSVSILESANPITFGQSVTLTAAVAGTDGKPLSGGTADFTSDGAAVGSAAVVNGNAAITITSLTAGTHQIGVTYTNPATRQTLTGSAALTVNKAAPMLKWTAPASISTLTPLSATQLDATATGVTGAALPGTFTYTPAAGTLLTAGTHTLSVAFAPTDAVDYTAATAQVTITVSTAPIALTSVSPDTAPIGNTPLAITLTGSGFTATSVAEVNGSPLPTKMNSATSLSATIPAASLAQSGSLKILVYDTASHLSSNELAFSVTAPTAQISVTIQPITASDQQSAVSIVLANPYPVDITGTLAMTFAPSGKDGVDDPAVQFSNGGRTFTFTIPAGATTAPSAPFQTGTVAGTITITTTLTAGGVDVTPADLQPITLTIAPSAPAISSVTFSNVNGLITVVINGFSNTREMTQADFTFTGSGASGLSSPSVKIPVTNLFTPWYSSADSEAFGSAFTYTQTFQLSKPDPSITGAAVTLSNGIGSSATANSQ